jgi:hypothetical protein
MLSQADIQEVSRAIAERVFSSMSQKMTPGRWLTMSEALNYARIRSKTTMLKWLNQGFVYGFKRSGTWIIDRESIDKWYSSETFDSNLY